MSTCARRAAPVLVWALACACSGEDVTIVAALEDGSVDTPAIVVPPAEPVELLAQLPAELELALGAWSTEPAFPALTFDDAVGLEAVPGTNTLYVLEREGRVYAFENRPDVTDKQLVLDLTAVNQGEGDSGLLGLAFHPAFGLGTSPNRAFVYVHYTFTPMPLIGERPPEPTRLRSRLSRFNVDPISGVFDRASELVLIDQWDDSALHQGGSLFFRPTDGFLYLAVGDEGGARCSFENCQIIDKDLFGGVLRIDVDLRGGDVSHPIRVQPDDGVTANYFIPNDNPFVGEPGVLEEFYAIGLRSPHRMTYDRVDDIAWIGDVGQAHVEELDILAKGANYQWPILEGGRRWLPDPPDALGVWTPPALPLPHNTFRAVIGGYVYRGSRLPDLRGRYIFGDFSTGRIWAVTYEPERGGASVLRNELLLENGLPEITSFGVDANGELFILTLGSAAPIQRLVSTTPSTNAPPAITQSSAEVVAGLSYHAVPYSVQSPLWSDGAHKDRWMMLPDAEKVGFRADGAWQFPAGTIFAKHFAIALDERKPSELTPLETRFLVATPNGGYYGLSYEWAEAGDRAEVVLQGRLENLSIVQADGSVRTQRYELPGPADCLVCHNPSAGFVLGVRTEQLNGMSDVPQQSGVNQLASWSELGLFENGPNVNELDALPRLPRPDDENVGLEARVRSYWAGNCSMCHGVNGEIRANWDARFATPLSEQGIIDGILAAATSPEELAVIVPGDPSASALFRRSSSVGSTRMPPLGRRRPDAVYLELLERWILSLEASR